MNATKVTRTFTLAGLVPAGKPGCSYRVLLPVLALYLATAAFSQTPSVSRGPGIPRNMLGAVRQAKPAASIPALAKYRFLTIDIPNSTGAQANGVNHLGLVTGWYTGTNYNAHGFIWQDGALHTIDYPGALDTYLTGVNNLGVVVGYYVDVNYYTHAFTYSIASATWSMLPDIQNYSSNEAFGINDAGAAVGYALGAFGYLAWIWHPTPAAYSFFSAPGAAQASTYAYGVNDEGEVVGEFTGVPSYDGHGFLKQGDTYTTIDVPGAFWNSAVGINNSGTIAGWFINNYELGFVRTSDGVFSYVNYPDAAETIIGGINDAGDICGYWYNSDYVQQAFVASPE